LTPEEEVGEQPEDTDEILDVDELSAEGKAARIYTLAKRRGFFWSSNEIYGGSAGFYDYGPLGTRLENNLVDTWRDIFVIQEGFAEISTPVITPEEVFAASGHLKEFTDLMVQCQKCDEHFRADLLLEEHHPNPDSLSASEIDANISENNVKCPACGGTLSGAYPFNLMFRTEVGPGSNRIGYLRPETAQGMFVNFHLLYRYFREKIPFGIVQIGSAYRNEIYPRQGMIRLREFKMAELEYFLDPSDRTHADYHRIKDLKLPMFSIDAQKSTPAEPVIITLEEAIEKGIITTEVMAYFIGLTYQYLMAIGMEESNVRFRQHLETEKAHYAEDCWDAEIRTSYGWIECVGIADRSCYDLEQHNKASGHTLAVTVHHKSPIEKEVKKLIINNKNLGRKYKALAKKIKSELESLDGESIPDDESAISLTIDGQVHEIGRDCFEIQTVVEKEFGRKIIPNVIEPSFGLDRIIFGLLENAYYERENGFRVIKLRAHIAPIKVGVFPLLTKPELSELARKLREMLTCRKLLTYYDESGSIGRRYARMDETGTPFCVTVDFDSLKDKTVTVRERDSTDQIRIKIDELPQVMEDLIKELKEFDELK
jgi:glycyl-tRNA synthetase